jgi:hypothetical protein
MGPVTLLFARFGACPVRAEWEGQKFQRLHATENADANVRPGRRSNAQYPELMVLGLISVTDVNK